jgi:transposase
LRENLEIFSFEDESQLTLRSDTCNSGFEIGRDLNAGINLKNYGLKDLGLGQPDFKPMENSMHKVDSMKPSVL